MEKENDSELKFNSNIESDYEKLKEENELLQIRHSSILKFMEILYNQNKELKNENFRLKSKLSFTCRHLAEKERLFLLLKSIKK